MPSLSGTPRASRILPSFFNRLTPYQVVWMGPVPIDAWMSTYAPQSKDRTTTPRLNFESVMELSDEDAIKNHLDRQVKGSLGRTFANNGLQFEAWSQPRISPDFTLNSIRIAPCHDDAGEARERHVPKGRLQPCILFGNVHFDPAYDPCACPPLDEPEEVDDSFGWDDFPVVDRARESRIRLFKIAQAAFSIHLRHSIAAFVVIGDQARLLYFDVAGVVFSDLFPWRTSNHLGELMLRVASASDNQRGFDSSSVLLDEESPIIEQAQAIFERERELGNLSSHFTWDSAFPLNARAMCSLFDVYDEPSGSFHRVLACHPHKSGDEYPGRGTRGFIAVDLDEERVVYMKRTWRMDSSEFYPERETLGHLESQHFPHLPGCYFGGDVPVACSSLAEAYRERTDEVALPVDDTHEMNRVHNASADAHRLIPTSSRGRLRVNRFVLHVLLFRKVCLPLKMFKHAFSLSSAVRDAIEAHAAAYQSGYLHADVSFGNILLYPVPHSDGRMEGILIDWELCMSTSATQSPRKDLVGTHQFQSSRILATTDSTRYNPVVQDDLESFVHILLFALFNYPTSFGAKSGPASPFDVFRNVFDEAGIAKCSFFEGSRRKMIDAIRSELLPAPFRTLLEKLRLIFKTVYRLTSLQEEELEGDPYAVQATRICREKNEAECNHRFILSLFKDVLHEPSRWDDGGGIEDESRARLSPSASTGEPLGPDDPRAGGRPSSARPPSFGSPSSSRGGAPAEEVGHRSKRMRLEIRRNFTEE